MLFGLLETMSDSKINSSLLLLLFLLFYQLILGLEIITNVLHLSIFMIFICLNISKLESSLLMLLKFWKLFGSRLRVTRLRSIVMECFQEIRVPLLAVVLT